MSNVRDKRAPLTQKEIEHAAETLWDTDNDLSDAETIVSDHDTDSDYNADSESEDEAVDGSDRHSVEEVSLSVESEIVGNESGYFYGKNRKKWAKTPPASSRTRVTNIVSHIPGLSGPCRTNKPTTPLQALSFFLDEYIINEVIARTNEKITELQATYGDQALSCQFINHVDEVEMRAFLGLLYLAGVFKSSHEDINSLFATDGTGRDIFRATMTLKRFSFLLTALRFDNPATRRQRIEDGDKLAAISNLFDRFIGNCKINYSCGEYVTVDEMLVGFRGKCRFRMFIKSKPVKYGLKILCLCDARTHYLINAFVYTGKDENRANPKKLSIPTQTVLTLIEPIANSNRNITGDNWFTSLELVEELQRQNLTYVGTIRRNKRELPKEFLASKQREPLSSLFGFTKDITIVSYFPKRNRSVCMMSTMHHNNMVEEGAKKLPDIISFYNLTKVGVDVLDQICANYKVGRRTRRWPLTLWCRMMDISAANAGIIYNAANPNNEMVRSRFLIDLGREMINEHLVRRSQMKNIPRELKVTIRRISNIPDEAPRSIDNPQRRQPKRARCFLCPYSDNKHPIVCDECSRHICKDHCKTSNMCTNCSEQ